MLTVPTTPRLTPSGHPRRRHRHNLTRASSILALVAASITVPTVAHASTSAIVVRGVLTDANGAPVAGQTVTASLEPNPDAMRALKAGALVDMPVLGSAVTGADGSFTVTTPRTGVSRRYLDAAGLASVMVQGSAQAGTFQRLRLRPAAAGQNAWQVDKQDVTDDATRSTTMTRTKFATAAARSGLAYRNLAARHLVRAGDGGGKVAMTFQQGGTSTRKIGAVTAVGVTSCPGLLSDGTHPIPIWQKTSTTSIKSVVTTRAYSASKTTTSVEYEYSGGLSMEIAWAQSGTYKGIDGKAGAGASISTAAGQGYDTSHGNNINATYEMPWQMAEYRQVCWDPTAVAYKATGYTEMRPNAYAGGFDFSTYTVPFTCAAANTVSMNTTAGSPSGKTWVENSTTTTYSSSFAFGTISLASTQTRSSRTKLSYLLSSGVSSAKICGRTNVPTLATDTREL